MEIFSDFHGLFTINVKLLNFNKLWQILYMQ